MAALQTAVVSQEADAYTLFRRICPDCGVLRPVKDYTTRRIRTVYGTVEVRNPLLDAVSELSPRPRSRLCAAGRNLPGPGDSRTDGMDSPAGQHDALSAGPERHGGIFCLLRLRRPMRPSANAPFERARNSTDRRPRKREERPPQTKDRRQLELEIPGDRRRQFVVSVDTAHVRSAESEVRAQFRTCRRQMRPRRSRGGRWPLFRHGRRRSICAT
jgi:hypothetical protein